MIFQRRTLLTVLIGGSLIHGLFPVAANAQIGHSDIRFSYSAGQIVVDTAAARGVGVGEFPVDGFFQQFESNPGFASENDVGFGINPTDAIVYNVLDDLLFWNGSDFVVPDPATQIRIENNAAAPDTLVSSSSGPQPGDFSSPKNAISQADGNGDFHAHVDFFLEPNGAPDPPPELGAYGLKLSLSTDEIGIADSDPFFIIFNFGLDLGSTGFEEAVNRFAELLAPELAGDYDRSGAVGSDDYQLWQEQFGSPPITSGSGADGNSDGAINGVDFLVWQRQLGLATSAATTGSAFAVPEPSVAAMVVTALGGMLASGCRSSRKCRRRSRVS